MSSNTWMLLLAITSFISCEASNEVQCPSSDYDVYKGKCYITGTRYATWNATKTACAKLGHSPMSIRTSGDLAYFAEIASNIDASNGWVGATDIEKEGEFIWEDTREPVTVDFQQMFDVSSNNDFKDCLMADYSRQYIFATECETKYAWGVCMGELNPIDTATQSHPIITPELCFEKADIVFLLDASTSIGAENWNYLAQTAANITKYFDVGPDKVRFAAMIFNRKATLRFYLKDYLDHDSLTLAFHTLAYPGVYGTKTYLALQDIVNKNMFGAQAGGRDDAPDNVIVMTDGQSDQTQQTLEAAAKLKEAGVSIITVGVGSNPSQEELREIASTPENALNASNSDFREKIMNSIVKKSCQTVEIRN